MNRLIALIALRPSAFLSPRLLSRLPQRRAVADPISARPHNGRRSTRSAQRRCRRGATARQRRPTVTQRKRSRAALRRWRCPRPFGPRSLCRTFRVSPLPAQPYDGRRAAPPIAVRTRSSNAALCGNTGRSRAERGGARAGGGACGATPKGERCAPRAGLC